MQESFIEDSSQAKILIRYMSLSEYTRFIDINFNILKN